METLLFFALGLSLLSILLMNKNQLAFAGLFSGGNDDSNKQSLFEQLKSSGSMLLAAGIIVVQEGDDDTIAPPVDDYPNYPTDEERYGNGGVYCDGTKDNPADNTLCTFMTNGLNNIAGCDNSDTLDNEVAPLNRENVDQIKIWKQDHGGHSNYNGDLTFLKADGTREVVAVVNGKLERSAIPELAQIPVALV